jgi:hypothetical protein
MPLIALLERNAPTVAKLPSLGAWLAPGTRLVVCSDTGAWRACGPAPLGHRCLGLACRFPHRLRSAQQFAPNATTPHPHTPTPPPAVVRRFNPALLATKAREQAALLAAKAQLDPGGAVLGTWKAGSDPCAEFWQGVYCDDKGERVARM